MSLRLSGSASGLFPMAQEYLRDIVDRLALLMSVSREQSTLPTSVATAASDLHSAATATARDGDRVRVHPRPAVRFDAVIAACIELRQAAPDVVQYGTQQRPVAFSTVGPPVLVVARLAPGVRIHRLHTTTYTHAWEPLPLLGRGSSAAPVRWHPATRTLRLYIDSVRGGTLLHVELQLCDMQHSYSLVLRPVPVAPVGFVVAEGSQSAHSNRKRRSASLPGLSSSAAGVPPPDVDIVSRRASSTRRTVETRVVSRRTVRRRRDVSEDGHTSVCGAPLSPALSVQSQRSTGRVSVSNRVRRMLAPAPKATASAGVAVGVSPLLEGSDEDDTDDDDEQDDDDATTTTA